MDYRKFWRRRFIVLLLLLVGATLRIAAPGEVPPGLYHDEAQHGLDALDVLQGQPSFYFAANNGREPLYIYLVTLFVGLLGRSPLAVRLPAFFAGFLTLAATYDLARVLFDRRTGRWALGVLAVTFWHVHLSRVGFRAVLMPLFTALFLAQAARGAKGGRLRHWMAAGALYGAMWYTYMGARFTPVALGVYLVYLALRELDQIRYLKTGDVRMTLTMARSFFFEREPARRFWRGLLVAVAAALLVLLPLGIYTLRHPEIVLGRTGQVSILNPEINEGQPWMTLMRHVWRTALMFFVRGDRIWRHNLAWRPVWGPALGLAFIFGLGGALAFFRRHAGAALVVIWTGVMLVPTILAEDAPHFLRATGVLPVVALLPALGLSWLARLGRSRSATTPPILRKAPLLLAILLLIFGLASTTVDYFVRYADAPLAYHWFEGGAVDLAGQINALRGKGWDGDRMLHGPETGRRVILDPTLWLSWTSMPYLVPAESITFFPPSEPPTLGQGLAFVVWPYSDKPGQAIDLLPHPARLSMTEGPQVQGDRDPEPYTVALIARADPLPGTLPQPVARFEEGITLREVTVEATPHGTQVQLLWEASADLDTPYTVFVHCLRGEEGLGQHDGPPGLGYLPTTLWQPGDLIEDLHVLPAVTPHPGEDRLRIGLYHSQTLEGISVLDEAGNPAGGWVEVPVR